MWHEVFAAAQREQEKAAYLNQIPWILYYPNVCTTLYLSIITQ